MFDTDNGLNGGWVEKPLDAERISEHWSLQAAMDTEIRKVEIYPLSLSALTLNLTPNPI